MILTTFKVFQYPTKAFIFKNLQIIIKLVLLKEQQKLMERVDSRHVWARRIQHGSLRGCVVVSVVDTSPDSYQKLIKSIKRDKSRRVPFLSVAPSIEPASL